MLPKKNRVGTKEVARIFKEGRSLGSSFVTFKYIKQLEVKSTQISFVVPKSVAKFAVKRNLLRRRGYLALNKHIESFPAGMQGVFVFKKYQDDISILEHEIKEILRKIN